MRPTIVSILALVVLLAAADAEAAWNPSVTTYQSSITTVRKGLSAYLGTGASASTMPARARRDLRRADKKLAQASRSLGTNPGWRQISKSLKRLRKAARYLERAGRKASNVTAFKTLLYQATTGVLPVLYGHSGTFAVSASTYVVRNHSSRRAAVKLLKAGARTTKARRLAGATPPRFSRAIDKNRDAIRLLGRSGLL